MKINEYISKSLKKIKMCTHKDTYNSAANYFRQPLLKILEKIKGCTYKITHMSVASYPILKLKPRTKFYHSVFFFLFNVFLYIHETSK